MHSCVSHPRLFLGCDGWLLLNNEAARYVFVLIFLVLWIKLRMEEQWMRSQFGETMPPMPIRPQPWCLTSSDRLRIGKWRFPRSRKAHCTSNQCLRNRLYIRNRWPRDSRVPSG
jgi:hypothetical protein